MGTSLTDLLLASGLSFQTTVSTLSTSLPLMGMSRSIKPLCRCASPN